MTSQRSAVNEDSWGSLRQTHAEAIQSVRISEIVVRRDPLTLGNEPVSIRRRREGFH
jgi:hypothetical protein